MQTLEYGVLSGFFLKTFLRARIRAFIIAAVAIVMMDCVGSEEPYDMSHTVSLHTGCSASAVNIEIIKNQNDIRKS